MYDDTEAPGDHQYLQDVAAYQKTGKQGQDYEQQATNKRVVKGHDGHFTEVTTMTYESQQSLEYPTTFLMPKPVHPGPLAYSYTNPPHQYKQDGQHPT